MSVTCDETTPTGTTHDGTTRGTARAGLDIGHETAAPAPACRSVRALTVGAVALVSLVAFEALAVSTVMPAVAAALDGLRLYALGFGATIAASVVGMAVAGAWSDVRGPRRPLVASVVLFALGLVVAGAAASMTVFVVGRAVQGLGGGMLAVALYAMLGTLVPQEARPRMLAAFAAAWVLPAMVGPAIAGVLLHAAGWRSVFLVVPALALPALALTLYAVRGGAPVVARGWDGVRDRVLLAAAAGTGVGALQVVGTRPGALWRLAAVASLAVVVGAGLRLVPVGTLRLVRGVPAVVAVRGLIMAEFAGAETFVPLLLVREHGWSPARAGLALTAGAFAWSATSWVQGRVADVERRYGFARVGTALLVVGITLAFSTALPGASGLLAVLGWGVAGGGMGLVYASTSLLSLHLSPPDRTGATSAALTTSEALMTAVGLAVGGAVFAALLPAGLADGAPAGPAPYLAAIGVALGLSALSVVAARRMQAR